MSDEEWEIHFAKVKQQRGIIQKGVRHEAIQKGFLPGENVEEPVRKVFKKGKTGRNQSFKEWFDKLPRRRKN